MIFHSHDWLSASSLKAAQSFLLSALEQNPEEAPLSVKAFAPHASEISSHPQPGATTLRSPPADSLVLHCSLVSRAAQSFGSYSSFLSQVLPAHKHFSSPLHLLSVANFVQTFATISASVHWPSSSSSSSSASHVNVIDQEQLSAAWHFVLSLMSMQCMVAGASVDSASSSIALPLPLPLLSSVQIK